MSRHIAIGKLVDRKPDGRTFENDLSLPLSNKYVGIEIEAENIHHDFKQLDDNLNFWSVKTDGSLRNHGAEFITPKLRGKDISLALTELNDKFAELGISPIFNSRTGLHVHVDVRSLTVAGLQSLVIMYLTCEPYLFSAIKHNRDLNNYCYPLYNNSAQLKILSKLFGIESAPSIREAIKGIASNSIKYNAFNIRSMLEKGTIEFRHHYGTSDTEIVLTWIRTILHLIRSAKVTPYTQLFDRVLTASSIAVLVREWCPFIAIDPDPRLESLARQSVLTLALCSPSKMNKELP